MVKKVRDEMVSKNEINNIITDIIRNELEGFKKELEEMKEMMWILCQPEMFRVVTVMQPKERKKKML